MSDVSVAWNDLIGFIHGKKPSTALSADAQKILSDAERIVAGVASAAPSAPALMADVAQLAAEGTMLAASKGLDLPELAAAGKTLQQLVVDFEKARSAFLAGMANYKTAAAVVASAPPIAAPKT